MPKVLHHYTDAETLTKDILKREELKANHIDKVDDPMRLNSLNFSGSTDDSSDFDLKCKNISKANKSIHSKLFLTCFSIIETEKESPKHDSVLDNMWTHYGDNHKGVCIAFNEQDFNKIIDDSSYSCIFRGPVNYPGNINLSTKINTHAFKSGDKSRKYQEVIKKSYIKHLFTKPTSRDNEKEYRYLIKSRSAAKSIYIKFKKPLYIVVGAKYKFKKNDTIYNYCNINNVPLYKIFFDQRHRVYKFKMITREFFLTRLINDNLNQLLELLNVDFDTFITTQNGINHSLLTSSACSSNKSNYKDLLEMNIYLEKEIIKLL